VIETSETRRFLAHRRVDLSNEQPPLSGLSRLVAQIFKKSESPFGWEQRKLSVKENIAAN
jgi:hypothetical protein